MPTKPLEDRPFWDLLPEIYRDDSVLSELLLVMERFYLEIEHQIDDMPDLLYNPKRTPEEKLNQVGRLVGLQNEENRLTPRMMRELLPFAFELQRWKGTRRALRFILRIYLRGLCDDPVEPVIVEYQDHCDAGEEYRKLFGGPRTVTVIVPQDPDAFREQERKRLESLVADYTPAHTEVQVLYLSPLGSGGLGRNTWLR